MANIAIEKLSQCTQKISGNNHDWKFCTSCTNILYETSFKEAVFVFKILFY